MAFGWLLALVVLFPGLAVPDPPDPPLRPEEWIRKMGNGNWMIFNIQPDVFTFADVTYSPDLLDSLLSIGQTGGRLHFRPRQVFTPDNRLTDDVIESLSTIIDDITERGMAVCLQYNPLPVGQKEVMDAFQKERWFKTWEQLCRAFKDKSHLLAMSPVIETHAWEQYDKQVRIDSLNWLYDSLTVVFRKYNPTRIISYKPWGAAKRAEFYTLRFPFKGNHPNPDSGYYVASFSGSYGLGHWEDYGIWERYTLAQLKEQTLQAGKLDRPDLGIKYAVKWRAETGIQVWIDHWEPDYWKNGNWTAEQNLAYTRFLLDTLQVLGIASAGPQTRRIWDNENRRFFNDPFTRSFIEILKAHNWRESTGVRKEEADFKMHAERVVLRVYPNPFNTAVQIEFTVSETTPLSVSVFDARGRRVALLSEKRFYPAGTHRIGFSPGKLSSGLYFCVLESEHLWKVSKMILLK